MVGGCNVIFVEDCNVASVENYNIVSVEDCWWQLVDGCDVAKVAVVLKGGFSVKVGSSSILVVKDGKKSVSLKISLLNQKHSYVFEPIQSDV